MILAKNEFVPSAVNETGVNLWIARMTGFHEFSTAPAPTINTVAVCPSGVLDRAAVVFLTYPSNNPPFHHRSSDKRDIVLGTFK